MLSSFLHIANCANIYSIPHAYPQNNWNWVKSFMAFICLILKAWNCPSRFSTWWIKLFWCQLACTGMMVVSLWWSPLVHILSRWSILFTCLSLFASTSIQKENCVLAGWIIFSRHSSRPLHIRFVSKHVVLLRISKCENSGESQTFCLALWWDVFSDWLNAYSLCDKVSIMLFINYLTVHEKLAYHNIDDFSIRCIAITC